MLDLHGEAWRRKDRYAEEPTNRAIAASGVLVVAIDRAQPGGAPLGLNVRTAHAAAVTPSCSQELARSLIVTRCMSRTQRRSS